VFRRRKNRIFPASGKKKTCKAGKIRFCLRLRKKQKKKVGLPNGPITPQWEVEYCSLKPWENGAGKGVEGSKDAVMDSDRGPPWKGPGSVERPCRQLTSLRTLIPPSMRGREFTTTTYINHLSLEFRGTKFMTGIPKQTR